MHKTAALSLAAFTLMLGFAGGYWMEKIHQATLLHQDMKAVGMTRREIAEAVHSAPTTLAVEHLYEDNQALALMVIYKMLLLDNVNGAKLKARRLIRHYYDLASKGDPPSADRKMVLGKIESLKEWDPDIVTNIQPDEAYPDVKK